MDGIINSLIENSGVVITACVSVFTAICAFVVSYFKSKKQKSELEIANKNLEIANVELQKAIIDGAFVICPKCGTKIYLNQVKVQTGKEND